MGQQYFKRATVEGVELEYEERGSGEPVVLVHPAIFGDWYKPLLEEPALAGRFRLVSYHRAGTAGSSRVEGPISIAQHAAHCRALMHSLGIARAHVVGHSSGATVVLQMALDAPEAVHTLALLEPARPEAPDEPAEAAFLRDVILPPIERYHGGDKAGALDLFLRGVCGRDCRAVLDRVLPAGAFERYMADADTFFGQELPALSAWSFTRENAGRITQPVLAVVGTRTEEVFRLRHELLRTWLPNVEPFLVADATHRLYLDNPRATAEGMAAFFERHPLVV